MNKRTQQWILISQFLMILSLEMTNPFLPLLIASQDKINFNLAITYSTLALATPMMANIIMGPVWGLLADRWGYKAMLMRTAWALVITQALMAVSDSTTWILGVRVLQGGFAGFLVAMQTYALTLCDWDQKSRQLARLQSTKAIATTIAGLAGGLVLTVTGFSGLYIIASLLCLITTLVMQKYLPSVEKNSRQLTDSVKTRKPWSRFLGFACALIMVTQLAKFLTDPSFALIVSQLFHANPLLLGLVYSAPAAGILLTSGWCGRQFDKCRSNPVLIKRYLIIYSLLGTILMILQARSASLLSLACWRVLWGIVLAALLPALFALVSDRAKQQGFALGLANSFAKLGNLSGLLIGGWLAAWLSFQQLLFIMACLYASIAIISAWYYSSSGKMAEFFPNSTLEQS